MMREFLRRRRRCLALLVAWSISAVPVGAIDSDRISLNGYSSFEIERQVEDEGEGLGDPNGSFDADLFDLVLNIQVDDRIRVAADVTWEHGAASEDGRGNVALEYGFVEYVFDDALKVRFGKMFTPFGIFNEIHTAKPAFLSVKEAASTNKAERIVDGSYRFFPRWGTGVGIRGGLFFGEGYLDYDLLIANGDQDETNPYEEDNNQAKSWTARLRYEVSDRLRVGTSFYYDKLSGPTFDHLVSEGLQVEYDTGTLRILAEAVLGSMDLDAGSAIKQLGWFIQPSYRMDSGLTPYTRLEFVDPDRDADDDRGFSLVIGMNYETSGGLTFKVEENYFKGGNESGGLRNLPGRDYSEIKAAVVLGF
jgi:hypothetical protein